MNVLSDEAAKIAAAYDDSRNALTRWIRRHPWTTFLAALGAAALAFFAGRGL